MSKPPLTKQANSDDGAIIITPSYEAFVLAIVVLSIVNSGLVLFMTDLAQREVVLIIQGFLCLFLIADAFYRLRRAHNNAYFLLKMYGALYFIGSLPVPFIFVLRLIPTWVMTRRLRQRDYEALGQVVVRRYAQSTLLAVVLAAILVLEFGSVLVLRAEDLAPNRNIQTASDALWWAIVTIATVGYGDRYPTTNWGRVIGVLMIVVGVGLFSSLTSFLAQWFLKQRSAQAAAQSNGQPAFAQTPDVAEPQPEGAASVSNGVDGTGGDTASWEQILALMQAHEESRRREVDELRRQLAALQAALPAGRQNEPAPQPAQPLEDHPPE
jgi:voltage-gated potassium channel